MKTEKANVQDIIGFKMKNMIQALCLSQKYRSNFSVRKMKLLNSGVNS